VTPNKQNILDIPTSFARANSISDVPCAPVLALRRTSYKTLIFFYGPALDDEAAALDGGSTPRDRAGTILDGATRPVLIFAFFTVNFFDTLVSRLSLTA
jgi:hypothetical protein